MSTTINAQYSFGNFMYKGYLYVLEGEDVVLSFGHTNLLSRMYKYDPAVSALTPVAIYTFEKRDLTGLREGGYYYGEMTDVQIRPWNIRNISIDEVGQRVLVVLYVAIMIDMATLTETGLNYYKVFPNASEYAAYKPTTTIYYARREGTVYGGDDHTMYITLDDQHVDSPLSTTNPGLSPLGSCSGILIPQTINRMTGYFVSPSFDGFKTMDVNSGEILDYIHITGIARAWGVNWNGGYIDHTWIDNFIFGDDGYLYVFARIVTGWRYFGLFDPLDTYDGIVIKYSIATDGTITEVARKLYSEIFSLSSMGSVGGYPVYSTVLLGASVSNGYVYFSCNQPYYGNFGQVHLGKLDTRDLTVVTTVLAPHYAASQASHTGALQAWKSTLPSSEDVIFYYCAQAHLHFLDTNFQEIAGIDPITINDGLEFGHYSSGAMYTYGYRGDGYLIIPGSHNATYVHFKTITMDASCEVVTDIPPQDMSDEILTNEFWGCGIDPDIIEGPLTQDARDYAIDNDLLFSFVFDQQRSPLDGLQYIAQHHNGYFIIPDGLIAHLQLEIDDADIVWQSSSALSDTFNDASTGSQWSVIGDIPRVKLFVSSTQQVGIHEATTVRKLLRIATAAEHTKISELGAGDMGLRYINIYDRIKASELGSMVLADKFINVSDGMYFSQGDRWDVNHKGSAVTLSNAYQTVTFNSSGGAVRSITKKSGSGKYYLEITAGYGGYFGFCDSSFNVNNCMGYDDHSYCYLASGYDRYYHNNSYTSSTVGQSGTDTLRVAIDLDNNMIWFGKRTSGGVSSWHGNPAAGTNPAFSGIHLSEYYVCVSTISQPYSHTVNLGQNAFLSQIPEGFEPWSKVNARLEGEMYQKMIQPMKVTELAAMDFKERNVTASDRTRIKDSISTSFSGNYYPAVGGDDYEWYSGAFYSSLAWWGFGAHDQSYHAGARFPSVTIPNGATITNAYIIFTGYQNSEVNDPHLHIYGNAVDNSTAPTSVSQAEALALTSAMVEWYPEYWNQNVLYYSPNLSTIIQEIVTRSGWSSGNALQIVIRNQKPVEANHSRSCYSYDGSVAKRPVLHIEWDVAGGIEIV